MIIPNLLLQKPSKLSKAKKHLKALERRLKLWKQSNLNELLHKAMTTQKYLKNISSSWVIRKRSKNFASLMYKGNVNAAIKAL